MCKIGTFQRNLFTIFLKSWNCNFLIKYFAMLDKNVATIFQLKNNIRNISDNFLQYSVLCEKSCTIAYGTKCMAIYVHFKDICDLSLFQFRPSILNKWIMSLTTYGDVSVKLLLYLIRTDVKHNLTYLQKYQIPYSVFFFYCPRYILWSYLIPKAC